MMFDGIAKPKLFELLTIAVVMPMTLPLYVIKGPPLLPELIGALVWIKPVIV